VKGAFSPCMETIGDNAYPTGAAMRYLALSSSI
jgi:hypothetical protein